MPRLTSATRSARRGQILAAAASCFAGTGYHATTMADVAARAGVSKGTPYLYFASKQALFLALHDEWDCGLSDQVEQAIRALPDSRRSSPRQVLRTVAVVVGQYATAHAETCRVLLEAGTLAAYDPQIAAAVRASRARTHRRLEELFAAGVAAGEWPADTDPALQARLFTASLEGLMSHWHLTPGSFSWEAAATALTEGRWSAATGLDQCP
ncbi:TetR/AcrR family transcriptional regulator [Streptomyces sediminimaris]|uniref:TetR/AcrR family transcriptional regulator n=1 Tax=Streptomyces sediminimaris TaxID=3383721 RepID=UPI00399A8C6E